MFQLDGKPLALDTPFEHNEISYPANWLRLATPAERNRIGISEVPDPVRVDDRFWWNGDLSTPKDLDQLKAQMRAQVKSAAHSMLSSSDWEVTRAAEGIAPMSPRTTAYRGAVRAAAAANEAAIDNCDSVAALSALSYQWPAAEDIEPGVPPVVSRFQARAALLAANLLGQVEALMADARTPAVARLAWSDAQEFKRSSPTVATMAAALGLTEQQLDALFIAAAGIDA